MACDKCFEKPVIKVTGSENSFCKACFFKYFEKKVKKTITKYNLIEKNDHIIVAVSGGKDSTVLLNLLVKVLNNMGRKKSIVLPSLQRILVHESSKIKENGG